VKGDVQEKGKEVGNGKKVVDVEGSKGAEK